MRFRIAPAKKNGTHNSATASITGISNAAIWAPASNGTGETRPDRPSTQRILKMLLPTTLPTAISRSPRMVATIDVTTSGNEVPAATIVRPITASLTPQAVASATALSTNNRAPKPNSARPPTTNSTFCHIGCGSFNNASTSSSPSSAPCFLPWRNKNTV